jgi:tRNA-specific 2-thiouridylase
VHSEKQVTVDPDSPIFGVAPGQAAVFYDEDRVIGGGWIRGNN